MGNPSHISFTTTTSIYFTLLYNRLVEPQQQKVSAREHKKLNSQPEFSILVGDGFLVYFGMGVDLQNNAEGFFDG